MTLHRSLLATLAFVGALTATASAQAPANKPTPCAGVAKGDPAGDNSTYLLGNDTGFASEANGDLLGVFFNRTATRTTINLTVAEVNRVVPPGSTSLAYRVFYTVGGDSRYLETGITTANPEPYFEYGLFEGGFTQEGETPGKWHEGPNGVIEIEIPQVAGGKVGTKFSEMYMWPGYLRGGIFTITDYIPDGGESGTRMTWNGASCPEGAAPAQPGSDPAPAPAPVPGSPPSSNPNPGAPAQAQGPLVVSVSPSTLKAKKVKRAKKLALKMETKEQLKDVVVTLKKGTKTLGAGKLATLTNISKLTLKLKKKGLKKGSYVLAVSAKRPDGSTGSTTLSLKVK